MDIEHLERLALDPDRSAALSALLPGTAEHDYWRGVFLLLAGRLDEVREILDGWTKRHGVGHHEHLEKLRRHHLLLRAKADLGATAEEIRREADVVLDDRAAAVVEAQRFPTKLAQDVIDAARLVHEEVSRHPDLSTITDAALPDVARGIRPDDHVRRRALLQRARRPDIPYLAEIVAKELAETKGAQFGNLQVHSLLTLEQLEDVAQRWEEVRSRQGWVDAVLARLRPPKFVDLRVDHAANVAFLDRVWSFVSTLPPSFNSLKANVLHRRLLVDRKLGVYDRDRLLAYLALPRSAPWVPRERIERLSPELLVQPNAVFGRHIGLEPVGDDNVLVRDLLAHFLANEDGSAFAKLVRPEWLEHQLALTRLLGGATGAEAERYAKILGATFLESLRDRVDIDLVPHNRVTFAKDDDVSIEVDVKNVPVLEVKVFRINTLAYFLAKGTDVDTSLDLDGLIAGSEAMTLRFDTPPMQRVRRKIDLPACKRPGTYVIELIGNGRSSRALVRKGGLRHIARISSAGVVVTVLDDEGRVLEGARVWLGGREHDARADGSILIPFSTHPGRTPILLVHGDVTQTDVLEHPAESIQLFAGVYLERESLVPGRVARVLCRPTLKIAGENASLSLLEEPRIDITVTDLAGTSTSSTKPIALRDDAESVIELVVPENAVALSLRLRGRVRAVSTQVTHDVEDSAFATFNDIHGTDRIATLHLARVEGGRKVLYALGKTGEPLAGMTIALSLSHQKLVSPIETTLETDEHGAIDLDVLPGIVRLTATLPSGSARSWFLNDAVWCPDRVHALLEREIVLPLPSGTTREQIALYELRHDVITHDAGEHLEVVDRCAVLKNLAPGEYRLVSRLGQPDVTIIVTPETRTNAVGWARASSTLFEITRPIPAVRSFTREESHVVLRLTGTSSDTRVHFVATRFAKDPVLSGAGLARRPVNARMLFMPIAFSQYISGRDIGDEYRYVLERRVAPRRPGTMLEKPGLFLNPWALRTTTTGRQVAAAGASYGAMPAAAAPAPPARPMRAMAAEMDAERSGPATGAGPALEATPTLDFLAQNAIVIANLRPDENGIVRVPLADLGDAQRVSALVVDPEILAAADLELPETRPQPRDLRLRLALDPAKHFAEDRGVVGVPAGTPLVVPDVRTGKLELIDTLARAHQLLSTWMDDPSLRELAFVAEWASFEPAKKRTLYSKYACHELHLFLWKKDPEFFASVVRPYLAHKKDKTFLDRFLLGEELRAFLQPWAFGRLNTVERILLGQRIPEVKDTIARIIGDTGDLTPPDPERDARIVATLLGASALEPSDGGAAAPAAMMDELLEVEEEAPRAQRPMSEAQKEARRSRTIEPIAVGRSAPGGGGFGGQLAADASERRNLQALYRGADKTQEWAETSWWKRRVTDAGPELVAPNRFWRDLAQHAGDAPFLSAHLADCTTSFADALCALTFLELPFVASVHETKREDTSLTVTPKSHVLAGRTRIVEVEAGAPSTSVLIGQSYFRNDDRYTWDGAERREKYVTGEMIVGVVYVCQVVVTNPTSAEQKLDVLLQIPKGAIHVANGFFTRTMHLRLDPYATRAIEYAFYFPRPGRFTHFPAHVTSGLALLAYAEAREIEVVRDPTTVDLGSWAHVSQKGSLDEVLQLLERSNLGRIDLDLIAWRMHDRDAFMRITEHLAKRCVYHDRLWSYALAHADETRFEEWLSHQDDFLRAAGPISAAVDPVARGWYQHLEYAPLVNARAHQLGARRRILNDGLEAQYRAFLELLAHREKPTQDDLLAAAQYLLCMDRIDEALSMLARVSPEDVATKLQHDYFAAYCACYRGDLALARRLATPWAEHSVDRWRNRHAALVAMLDEVERPASASTSIIDQDSRAERMNEGAARQPALEISASGFDIVLQHHNVNACELRFYEMDIELLFSRQPFVQGDVERFSFIEPGHTLSVSLPQDGRTVVPIPEQLRGANVVIEAVAPGLRKAVAHYAHDLGIQLAHAYGQVRVVRASTQGPLPATYVKVYGRQVTGAVAFYKDGYTDLRGRFDYATLSTDDLDRVQRFAILVVSDDAGATILEAPPPAR